MDEVRWRETDGWSPTFCFVFEVNNLFLLPLFLLIVIIVVVVGLRLDLIEKNLLLQDLGQQ